MRRRRLNAYTVALSGVACAFAVLALVGAAYLPTGKIAMYAWAGLCVALPLTRRQPWGAVAVYAIATALGALFANIRIVPFALFFGLYPIVTWLCEDCLYRRAPIPKAVKIAIIAAIKIAFFLAAFFAGIRLMRIVIADLEFWHRSWTLGALLALAFVAFAALDTLYRILYRQVCAFVSRHLPAAPRREVDRDAEPSPSDKTSDADKERADDASQDRDDLFGS